MRKELEKLTTKQLIELIKTFEHYPAVTLKDGKDYILSYLEDEACTISKKEIAEYLIKSGVEITKDNIHLYYEFMSDEDLKKIFNWSIMSNVFGDRIIYITDIFGWRNDKKVLKLEYWKAFDKYYVKNNDYTRFSFFGIMDTLKPIDEYIAAIKDSEQYKIFTSECRCNNCMTYFESDDDLIDGEDEDCEFKGCPKCNTDKYLMSLADLK